MAHDEEFCFCRRCTERLLRKNSAYLRAWVRRQMAKAT